MADLTGKKIAFVATNGFEDSELTEPWKAVSEAGGTPVMISPESGSIEGKNGHKQAVDMSTSDASAADFQGLVLPGGVVNGDTIRMDESAVSFVREIFAQHKPVGAICHGGWILADADVLKGRKLTSYASLQTDLRNAGAEWVDEEVVVDAGLVSSRTPDDLPAFNSKIVEEFAEGKHEGQTA
ncbi:type 1 glutamine amidotransferase [Salinibacterium sp. dk2585]|uniref:type 1 glutamine amidotransferase domain-containing protein n=1 Tax=unclassified Salinibacterium TaxID=2632331 RepID=UPI0011C244B4|nr:MULTISPECIES: type 1 glutamine amidotransferase domain-containing protein [unclassified Salinibacterium]QEE62023.1 type 1 glutamine amidotransferase [Salinibacterium sp. dk2585]TXK54422.1 type 1 glutamine amidotransferase [Salinibacterium sp. dk5596]